MNSYAIILAAGIGSRLAPLTEQYPKSLVKVNGKEILSYQIDGYLSAGIKEENIYIITGYKHEMITAYLKRNYPKVQEIYSADYLTTNNMYSLYLGLNQINKISNFEFESLLINNADCLYDNNLISELFNCKYENAIATEVGNYIEESMKVTINNDLVITDIAKSISEESAYGVSVDLYKYCSHTARKLFEIVKDFIEIKKDLKQWTEVAFPFLFKTEKVYPFDIKNKKWVEVDNNDDLLIADELFSKFDITGKKCVICDMDGTLYVGDTPINNAINFVKKNKDKKYYFLTNNTSKVPIDYVIKLERMGLKVQTDDILTPLYPLINYIKEKSYKSIYLVATQMVKVFLMKELPSVKFEFDEVQNQAVILAYDTEINYEKMKNISVLLNNSKIEYLATHTDVFCPSEKGNIPDIGSFIKLIELTTGKTPDKTFGKPSVNLVKNILKIYNKEDIVVGDRLYTDKALADNIGCDFICVLSGETKRIDIQNYQGKCPAIVKKELSFK